MDKNSAVEIKNISKKYYITKKNEPGSYDTFREFISRKIANLFKGVSEGRREFWALGEVNLTIKKGEKIAILGHNGAGKSTLLKVLSSITSPTTGSITIDGKVSSLLEVGTGFHPELTGRENVFLNGAILGMKREETKRKLQDIVEFAGISEFLDTPVKRYSSGMRLRLGFAIAAHLSSDILIVDEVLAVGDTSFQEKCLGKMDDISKEQGRTIIFVSHNLSTVQQLCDRAIVLNEGKVYFDGDIPNALNAYKGLFKSENLTYRLMKKDDRVNLSALPSYAYVKENSTIIVEFCFTSEVECPEVYFDFGFYNHKYLPIFHYSSPPVSDYFKLNKGENFIKATVENCNFNIGKYFVGIYLAEKKGNVLFEALDIDCFEVTSAPRYIGPDAIAANRCTVVKRNYDK